MVCPFLSRCLLSLDIKTDEVRNVSIFIPPLGWFRAAFGEKAMIRSVRRLDSVRRPISVLKSLIFSLMAALHRDLP